MPHPDPAAYRLDHVTPGGGLAADLGYARQVMAADLVTRGDGWERGVRSVVLQNDLLSLDVVVDRSLDIAVARIRQVPIGWRSPTEIVAPWYVENAGFGTHRSFFGGLLKTCGLDHFGMPRTEAVPEGAQITGAYPMHGRIGGAPAKLGGYGVRQAGQGLEAYVEGSVTQVALFDEHLTLDRRISIVSGSPLIRVTDRVTNHGYRDSRLAVLYHVNIGWPVLGPDAILSLPRTRLRGEGDPRGIGVPSASGSSRGWMFESEAGANGRASAAIANTAIDATQSAGLRLSWDPRALPTMALWQMNMPAGNYVLALEPTTMSPDLSAAESARFPVLRPGESVDLGIDIELLHGPAGATLI